MDIFLDKNTGAFALAPDDDDEAQDDDDVFEVLQEAGRTATDYWPLLPGNPLLKPKLDDVEYTHLIEVDDTEKIVTSTLPEEETRRVIWKVAIHVMNRIKQARREEDAE